MSVVNELTDHTTHLMPTKCGKAQRSTYFCPKKNDGTIKHNKMVGERERERGQRTNNSLSLFVIMKIIYVYLGMHRLGMTLQLSLRYFKFLDNGNMSPVAR